MNKWSIATQIIFDIALFIAGWRFGYVIGWRKSAEALYEILQLEWKEGFTLIAVIEKLGKALGK